MKIQKMYESAQACVYERVCVQMKQESNLSYTVSHNTLLITLYYIK